MDWEGEAEAGAAKLTSVTYVWVKRRGGRPPRWEEKGSGGGAARGEYLWESEGFSLLARVRVFWGIGRLRLASCCIRRSGGKKEMNEGNEI